MQKPELPNDHTPERARLDYQNGRGCLSTNGKYLDAYHDEHERNPRPSLNTMNPSQALTQFANRRPLLDRNNYDSTSSRNADARTIAKQLHRFRALQSEAAALGTTDQDILDAAPRAFSGRLQFHVEANPAYAKGGPTEPATLHRVEYTAGQYYPTEYRAAACAVLSAANDLARRRNPPQDADVPATLHEMKERNRAAGSHYFSRDALRFFGSRFHGAPFAGCVIESVKPPHGPRYYRPIFVRANGQTWREPNEPQHATARRARAHAFDLYNRNAIKWTE